MSQEEVVGTHLLFESFAEKSKRPFCVNEALKMTEAHLGLLLGNAQNDHRKLVMSGDRVEELND